LNWEYHYYLKAQIHEAGERFRRERRLREENRRGIIDFALRLLVIIALVAGAILFPVFFPAHRDIGYGGFRDLLLSLSVIGVFFFFFVFGTMPLCLGICFKRQEQKNALVCAGIGIVCYIGAYLLY